MTSRKSTSSEDSHETVLTVTVDEPQQASVIATSLQQEVGEIDDDRSTARVACSNDTVEVIIEAADLVALRAALTTWLSLLGVATESVSIAEG